VGGKRNAHSLVVEKAGGKIRVLGRRMHRAVKTLNWILIKVGGGLVV
jgi:hypothetical protein